MTFQICGGSSSIGGGGRACGKMPVRAPKIPQLDGPIPDPYEELSTPNVKTILKILHVAHIIMFLFIVLLLSTMMPGLTKSETEFGYFIMCDTNTCISACYFRVNGVQSGNKFE